MSEQTIHPEPTQHVEHMGTQVVIERPLNVIGRGILTGIGTTIAASIFALVYHGYAIVQDVTANSAQFREYVALHRDSDAQQAETNRSVTEFIREQREANKRQEARDARQDQTLNELTKYLKEHHK